MTNATPCRGRITQVGDLTARTDSIVSGPIAWSSNTRPGNLRLIEDRETAPNLSNLARIFRGGVVAPNRVLFTTPYARNESQRFQGANLLASVALRPMSSFNRDGANQRVQELPTLIHPKQSHRNRLLRRKLLPECPVNAVVSIGR